MDELYHVSIYYKLVHIVFLSQIDSFKYSKTCWISSNWKWRISGRLRYGREGPQIRQRTAGTRLSWLENLKRSKELVTRWRGSSISNRLFSQKLYHSRFIYFRPFNFSNGIRSVCNSSIFQNSSFEC